MLIHDGQTKPGYIAAAPGLHGALRFRYRPMTQVDWEEHLDRISGKTGKHRVAIRAQTIRRHLADWDATDAEGQPLALEAASVMRLLPPVAGKLVDIVAGYRVSDPDPDEAPPALADLELQRLLEQAETGLPPGLAEVAEQQKNSSAG